MKDLFFIDFSLKQNKYSDSGVVENVSDEDLKIINSMKKNAPLKKVTKEDIQTRSIIIMGEEPTSKLSIHPECELNGKKISILSKLAKLLPGAPMLTGHRTDKTPWGRTYSADVINGLKGYTGSVVKEKFWFLNDEDGKAISRKIDCGIWSEGSISYWFTEARCSICHKKMAMYYWGDDSKCKHILGEKDKATGQICYWYPHGIQKVAETSYVFAGAYGKTKSMLTAEKEELVAAYSEDQIIAGKELETQLSDCGLNFNQGESDETINSGNNGLPIPIENKSDEGKSIESKDSGKSSSEGNADKKTGNSKENSDESDGASGDGNTENNDSTDKETGTNDPTGNSGSGGRSDRGENQESEEPEKDKDSSKTTERNQDDNKNNDGVKNAENSESNQKEENSEKTDKSENQSGNITNRGESVSSNTVKNEDSFKKDGENTENDEKNEKTESKSTESSEKLNKDGFKEDGGCDSNKGDEGKEADLKEKSYSEFLQGDSCKLILTILEDTSLDNDEVDVALSDLALNDAERALCGRVVSEHNSIPNIKYLDCPLCGYVDEADGSITECGDCGSELIQKKDCVSKLFSPIGAIKPKKSGRVNNEYFKKEDFRMLPDGTYNVEPKYTGVWFEMHKSGNVVKMFTDDGIEYSEKFPAIVAEAKKIVADNFIIIGEMVKYRGRQRLTCESVSSWIDTKQEAYDDKTFRYKPFTAVYMDNKNIVSDSLEDRRNSLDKNIKWGTQIHPTKFYTIKHKKGDGALVKAIDDRKTREGTMVKDITASYSKKDESKIFKWTSQNEVDCRVVGKNEKEDGFIYTCEIGRGKKVVPIGNTYSSSINVAINSILTVSVDHVNYDKEKDEYSWFAPKVIALRKDKKEADLLLTIKRISILKELDSIDNAASSDKIVPEAEKNCEYTNTFVVQEHGWGNKIHYDIRFSSSEAEKTWGFVCFSAPSGAVGKKVRCQEKECHDVKWMDVDTKEIKFGEAGNPTKSLNAWMVKKDGGEYEYIKRKSGFLELVLHGEKCNGRYLLREIPINVRNGFFELKIDGDEVATKNEKIWVMWKPKNQEANSPVNKLTYKFIGGHLAYWESDELDSVLEALEEV